MREILFRGKRTDNDEWIKGYLHKTYGVGKGYRAYAIQVQDIDTYMCRPHSHEVQPETVGQFTGLIDKNGKKIFEGDILKGLFRFSMPVYSIVSFNDGAFGLLWYREGVETFWAFTSICNVEYEVIGNIHDNPELLEVE